jgi:hypothetical protein
MADRDLWLGRWELDPATIDYQLGRPGRSATYVIQAAPGGGYTFILDAEDAAGNPVKAAYGGLIDGIERELPGGLGLVLTQLGSHAIESKLTRGAVVLDRWLRELEPDGSAIRFTQFRTGPDGMECRNCSVYRRV